MTAILLPKFFDNQNSFLPKFDVKKIYSVV